MIAASVSSLGRLRSPAARAISRRGAAALSSAAAPETPASLPSAETESSGRRRRALSLYRQLLRGAEGMPTPNRQNYVKRKTRSEYKRHASLTDADEIEFQLRLADTNLDTVLVQAEHLKRLFNDPEYQNHN
eukprot:CAMPEP_0172530524 /NCGR_PEP_ID=MMETSP1067-20121228/4240_1 /TAXON_ID=265564 ORGANISM="Thalassiosira punctigera, Strain Tpunct2005C2" /NCGR_SAMPLE_ID=MMETSP1067 /ASSEMBLY_ACC=CAM_ASM_000444 /LENGTH=131 /DNA_ID=CAMNT_0013314751 /DNA_START=34 /DNA_END=432 /DNA_ORIENTATION=+